MKHSPHFPGSPSEQHGDAGLHKLMQMQRELWYRWLEAGQGWLKWWLPEVPSMPWPPAGHVAPPEDAPPLVAPLPVSARRGSTRPVSARRGSGAARKPAVYGTGKSQRHH